MKKCFFLLFCLSFLANVFAGQHQNLIKQGQLDLRNYDFSEPISLDGEWVFYWQRLWPDTIGAKAHVVPFPKLWNYLEIDGEKLGGIGYGTYKLTILLPEEHETLRLEMPEVYTAYRMYLNGEMVLENGHVSDNEHEFVPQWLNKAFTIRQGLDTAELVLEIANFVHFKGGINESIFLGKQKELSLQRRRTEAVDLFLTGCLLMGGLFFLGLYLLGNRDKAILLFSLYSIVYSYRIVGIENYTLNNLIPDISWYTLVYFEYLTLFISIGIFAYYTKLLYPLDVNTWVTRIIFGICMLFALITIFFPPYYFTQLINPFLGVTIVCILYALYIYNVAFKSKRLGSEYALLSTIALMMLFILTILDYWALWQTPLPLTFWGYISFFFLQSLVLSQRVSFQLKESKHQAELGLKAKSEFLSNMSHEIRTPLNSVIGMSHVLKRSNPRPDQQEQLDTLLFSANNLLTIVNDILDYNKLEAGKLIFNKSEMDLKETARNIVAGMQNFASDKGISLILNVDPELNHQVLGDQTRFFQVLNNLVHNAIKFTEVGSVQVNLHVLSQTENEITIKVEVVDTGIGISEANQEIIFNRFTQADSSASKKFGGTGLGLAISKKILELQGSDLKLESEVNIGSTFYFIQVFEKTRKLEKSTPIKTFYEVDEMPLKDKSILLVEDNKINVMVARSFLQNWGIHIDVAENGQEALDLLDPNKHQLVLMDLHMPIMDGYVAAKKIREKGILVPIIALTANLREDIESKLDTNDFNGVIVKPFLPEELYQKINTVLK